MGPPHLRGIVGRAGDVVEKPERERFVVVVPGEKLSDGPVIGGRFITHKNAVGADESGLVTAPVAALYAEDYRGAGVPYARTFNFTVHVYEFLSDEFGNRKGENM